MALYLGLYDFSGSAFVTLINLASGTVSFESHCQSYDAIMVINFYLTRLAFNDKSTQIPTRKRTMIMILPLQAKSLSPAPPVSLSAFFYGPKISAFADLTA